MKFKFSSSCTKRLFIMMLGNKSSLSASFSFQNLQKPIPTHKLYLNCNLYPLLKDISYVSHFTWLLGCALAIYKQTIDFQGRHVYKTAISYKKKGDVFQDDCRCDQGNLYFFLKNECPPKGYK